MRQSGSTTRFGRSKISVTSQILATGFASGVRPCVGSIFVLIASVAAHAPWIGIAATFAIGAGVAVTVTLFGLGAVGANRFVMARSFRLRSRIEATKRVVAVTGALVIVLFGAVQTALILTGYLQPALT
jgi:ABC-type nickel/cobalt efflux system permease component RcnA